MDMSAEEVSIPLWIPVLLGGTLLLSLAAIVAVILLSLRVNKLAAALRAQQSGQPTAAAQAPITYGQPPRQGTPPGQQPPAPPPNVYGQPPTQQAPQPPPGQPGQVPPTQQYPPPQAPPGQQPPPA